MHVITNLDGKIVAAMHGELDRNAGLFPLEGQRMHRLEDVPIEIAGLVNPAEFHKAISAHFVKKGAKVTPVVSGPGKGTPHKKPV
jgi:hypothetical protein